jgi:hypothetical protein
MSARGSERVLRFVAHETARYWRGYGRYRRFLLAWADGRPDPIKLARLDHEKQRDAEYDRRWQLRHGPIPGGAKVLQFHRVIRSERKEQHGA